MKLRYRCFKKKLFRNLKPINKIAKMQYVKNKILLNSVPDSSQPRFS